MTSTFGRNRMMDSEEITTLYNRIWHNDEENTRYTYISTGLKWAWCQQNKTECKWENHKRQEKSSISCASTINTVTFSFVVSCYREQRFYRQNIQRSCRWLQLLTTSVSNSNQRQSSSLGTQPRRRETSTNAKIEAILIISPRQMRSWWSHGFFRLCQTRAKKKR